MLDVNGDARVGNLTSRRHLKISSAEWPEIRFDTPTSIEQMRLGVAHQDHTGYGVQEGDMYIYTQTATTMPFILRKNGDVTLNLKGGSVGIGTTATSNHKLVVEGSIGSREVVVETSAWSDFVFANDYHLQPLEEVEEFINNNQHLPEIPSESEVVRNGINLGEIDAKLLQKIEELTLHMIEMNKRVKQLEKENKILKAKGKL